jgi:DNA-binding CsgD family transcriptional regulator
VPVPTTFSEVVSTIYGIPEAPELLGGALEAVGTFCGTPDVHLLLSGQGRPQVYSAKTDAAEGLAQFWLTSDLAPVLGKHSAGELVDIGRLVGYTRPNWTGALAVTLPLPAGYDPTVLVVPLQCRSVDTCAEVTARVQQLLPHLTRAVLLWRKLASDLPTVKATAQLMQDLPLPALLTDREGRCIQSNSAFQSLKDKLGVQIRAGRLLFRDEYLQDSWQSALRETVGTAVGRGLLADSGMGRQWKVHLQPVLCTTSARGLEPQQFVMALLEEQGAMPYADPERIATVSKLTPAELNVLSGLLQGYTGKVIARSRNASVNTVRSQIMSILTKTGHHSQKELIASFSSSMFDPNSMLQSNYGVGARM